MIIKDVSNMFWGVTLDGGKKYTQTVERSFHLSMAALEPSKISEKNKETVVSVMIQHEKAEFMLCTLQQGKLYQQPLDLNFTEGEEVTFFLSNNSGVVHLSGFLIEDDQYPDDFSEDMMDDSDDEVPTLIGDPCCDEDDVCQMVKAGTKRKNAKEKKAAKKMKLIEDSDDDDDDDDEDSDEFADFIDDEAEEDSDEDEDEEEEEEEERKVMKKKKKQENPQKKALKKENTKQEPMSSQESELQGEGKKKKKKKKKKKVENEETNSTEAQKSKQQQPKKQVLAGGVVSEELKSGHGPVAQAGKMVHVYYSGKLQKSGKQFDSCIKGKPFRFRLGKGEVIKGWDTGVSGMKVGGKRKLIIPSPQAYGNQRQGPIPAGSTLIFEVELKAVS